MTVVWLVESIQNWKASLLKSLTEYVPVRTIDIRQFLEKKYPKPSPGRPHCLLLNKDSIKENQNLDHLVRQFGTKYQLPTVTLSDQFKTLDCARDLALGSGSLKGYQAFRLPVSIDMEILARFLEGLDSHKPDQGYLRYLDIEFNLEKNRLSLSSQPESEDLTPKEGRILKLFILSPGRCWSRDELREMVWDGAIVSPRTIDSQISRLRKKLQYSKISIENIYGNGYIFK